MTGKSVNKEGKAAEDANLLSEIRVLNKSFTSILNYIIFTIIESQRQMLCHIYFITLAISLNLYFIIRYALYSTIRKDQLYTIETFQIDLISF